MKQLEQKIVQSCSPGFSDTSTHSLVDSAYCKVAAVSCAIISIADFATDTCTLVTCGNRLFALSV